jgi:diguanylate cyclase (GGDEF)-like protein
VRPRFGYSIFRPTIGSRKELHRYVAAVACAALGLALAVDVVNQLTFYVDLETCLRSWAITVVLALSISAPIARAIGLAHLELYYAKLEADRLGRTDPLTGLANRRAFTRAGEEKEPHILALAIADIDRFKRVNDDHGHIAGDVVIKAVAEMMQSRLGSLGVLARVGGEEFALLCPEGRFDEIKAELSRLLDLVAQTPIAAGGQLIRVTISVGVAAGDGASFNWLYAAADKALYAAKAAGRNRIIAFDEIYADGAQDAA